MVLVASQDRYVVRAADQGQLQDLEEHARRLGSVKALEGARGLLEVHLRDPSGKGRSTWESLRAELGPGIAVHPVFLDAHSRSLFPTGRITVRFKRAFTDPEMGQFAAKHSMRLLDRNRYVPMQATFEPSDPGSAYLPDLLTGIEDEEIVSAAWPDTLSSYHRT